VRRSTILRLGAAVPLAAAFAPVRPALAAQDRVRALVPVAISPDAVTRTTVGLRPYRRSGFVVRAEAAGDKTIVHDYGHGGGGMSLSWGTALQARDLALATTKRVAAVIGCGVIGLTTARVLQDAGFSVTIYAADLPPSTTSNLSGAQWTPTSVYDRDAAGAPFLAQFADASELAQRRFQTLLGEDYGVRWIENYSCFDEPGTGFIDSSVPAVNRHLYPEVEQYGPGEHPFPTRFATRFLTMLIEPNRYLRALERDYVLRGGRIVVRRFADRASLTTLDEPLIMNCTGLGARALFGDEILEPVRGQLTVLAPQPKIDYIAFDGGYMFPRSDGIVLGGTFQHGDWNTAPDPATERRILEIHRRFFTAMALG
jgi:D-amino-acid oxidase